MLGRRPPFPVRHKPNQNPEAQAKRLQARKKEIANNKIAHANRNDGFALRYGKYWFGVGKGVYKLGKELILMGVDLQGNYIEGYTSTVDKLLGGGGKFSYNHYETSALGITLAKPETTAGSLATDLTKGILSIPGEWIEVCNMETW